MDFTTIGAILGAVGGLDFIKWLFNRKRIGKSEDYKLLKETNEFLQQQLKVANEQYADQTQRLRTFQDELIEERELRHKLEMELERTRCRRGTCPARQPQNAITPALSKETLRILVEEIEKELQEMEKELEKKNDAPL